MFYLVYHKQIVPTNLMKSQYHHQRGIAFMPNILTLFDPQEKPDFSLRLNNVKH